MSRPTATTTVTSPGSRRFSFALSRTWRPVRHYIEMIVAMLIGMVVLGLLHDQVWPSLTARTDAGVLIMATDMSIGMAAWMRVRGHSWRGIAEMSASMYAPFVVLLIPYWTGSVSSEALVTWGHVAMFASMALVMYLRREEYIH